ncbi:MAG: OmpA family protein [Wenzhouxiangellaceae bacterium]|nr:OmpA family protein [Wenzhouxiangellaceae bacterium]
MRFLTTMQSRSTGRTTALLSALLILAACATTPQSPPGAAEARSDLSALQSDPNLAARAPLELREAEAAVRIAERPLAPVESSLGEHRVFMAERKIDIARARATGRYAMDQRAALVEERDQARLAARSREAELARADASRARSDANLARSDASRAQDAASLARYAEVQAMAEADAARRDADAARSSEARATASADARTADLERQINALEAEITDRGLVLTLGDLLFATDRATLEPGADRHLDRLAGFLERYPGRRVEIEGHTDNVGAGEYNLGLSRRRAESVLSDLTRRGIDSNRLSALGFGQERPIASNLTAAGRQQNRRVEIIIENPETLASDY